MGNNCCGTQTVYSRNYLDVDREEEYNIRLYEEQIFGAMNGTFSSIRLKLRFKKNKKISIETFEKMYKEELRNSHILHLIEYNTKYFELEKGYYSVQKIKLLIYLLSQPEKYLFKDKVYFDKASFLIQEILMEVEEDLNDNIEADNRYLVPIITYLVEISLNVITKYFLNVKAITLSKYFDEIFKIPQEKIVDHIIKEICSLKKIKVKTYSTNPLERFSSTIETDKESIFTEKEFKSNLRNTKNVLTMPDNGVDLDKRDRMTMQPQLKDIRDREQEFFSNTTTTQNKEKEKEDSEFKDAMSFNFYDLNSKIFKDNFFLTSGYIRELAYHLNVISNNKIKLKDKPKKITFEQNIKRGELLN